MYVRDIYRLRNISNGYARFHAEMASMLFPPFHSLCDYLSMVSGFEVDKVWPYDTNLYIAVEGEIALRLLSEHPFLLISYIAYSALNLILECMRTRSAVSACTTDYWRVAEVAYSRACQLVREVH